MLISRRALLLIPVMVCSFGAWAEESLPLPAALEPAYCGPIEVGESSASPGAELEVEAGQLTHDGDQLALRSDVRLRHGAWRAATDAATIDQATQRAVFAGQVRISGPSMALEAARAELDFAENQTRVDARDARFRFGHGGAGHARHLVHGMDGVLEISDAEYSTCSLDDPLWHLEAEQLRIDPEQGQGEAHDAVLRVGAVPVMALPWVAFPVGDARQSGWLAPEFGTSDDLGYSLELPYYLNLAPHYDTVLSARFMGRRGLQAKSSSRYRTRHGHGALQAEFLADNEDDDDRHLLHWRHRTTRPDGWDYGINYTGVSDREYVEDFEPGIEGRSTTHLRQEAHLAWRADDWTIAGALTGVEPLKDHAEQWDRLPRLRAAGVFRLPAMELDFLPHLAVDAFRGNAPYTQAEGERVDAGLAVAKRVRGTGWALHPRLQVRHTRYSVDYANAATATDRSPTRTVPIFSLDARARLQRHLDGGDLHTLEPRLFYYNRPRRDETDIPMFDTRPTEPDFDALFRAERQTGSDRLGATDFLAAGLVTRVMDPARGYLKLRARLGRVWHFRDRTPGDVVEGDPGKSAWAGGLEWQVAPQVQLRSALRYDPSGDGTNETAWASHLIRWEGGDRGRMEARYLRRDGEMEQAGMQALLPLATNWQLALRYRYDLRESRDLETLAALEYQSCCITVGVGAWRVRRTGGTPSEEYENRLLLQVRFHGLVGLGENVAAGMRRQLDGTPVWSR